jgi:hypothetical protein
VTARRGIRRQIGHELFGVEAEDIEARPPESPSASSPHGRHCRVAALQRDIARANRHASALQRADVAPCELARTDRGIQVAGKLDAGSMRLA